jgi:hypothetical protein
MGTAEPDVWARTVEISFGKVEVSRHEFYDCFEPEGVEVSAFDAVARVPGRAICLFRVGFKTDEGHAAFVSKYSRTEAVTINGKEVSMKIRDRTLNLVRVRVHHFKFDDELGLLATRLRQYGTVTKYAWDTYQDRLLPKWSGTKTGVVNVDMELHADIPSYINFGSYRHPLMVEYAGQTKTCRLCDSPCHVSYVCPKLAHKVVPVSIPKNPVGSTRSYSDVLSNPPKKPTSGWQTRQGSKYIATEEPSIPTVVAQVSDILNHAPEPLETIGSNPHQTDDFVNDGGDDASMADDNAKEKRKRNPSSSKEQRDKEKQRKREERRSSQGASSEETGENRQSGPTIIQETPPTLLPLSNGSKTPEKGNPLEEAPGATETAPSVDNMDTDAGNQRSSPEPAPLSQDGAVGCSEKMPEGEKPPDALCPPSNLPAPKIVTQKSDMEKKTLDAMEALRKKKLDMPSQKSRIPSRKTQK